MKYLIPAIKEDKKIKAIDQFDGKDVFIFDRLYPNPQKRFLSILCMISDISWHTDKIALVVPYFPFLRQDHDSTGTDPLKFHEGKTAWISLRILGQAGLKYLITIDGHCFKGPGVFTTDQEFRRFPKQKNKETGEEIEVKDFGIVPPELKIVNITMAPEIKKKVLFLTRQKGYKKVLFISPDRGASYMTEINLEKERDPEIKEGVHEITEIRSEKISAEELKEYDAVCFVDDLVASGGTIMDSVTYFENRGVIFTPWTNEFESPPKEAVDLYQGIIHFQGFEYAVCKLSSVGISEKRTVVTNSIVEGNEPLANGNAVRVQNKLTEAASLIEFDKKKDVPALRKFLHGPQ